MALDYSKCAGEICEHVGGASNILSADHCDTRLRLVLADMDKADRDALEEIEGVRAALESNGQLQLIIGTGVVNKVFDELRPIIGSKGGSGKEAGPASGQPVSGSVPAALVAGILGALVVLLLRSGILSGNAAGMQTLLTTVNVILCVIALVVCGVLVFLFTGINRRKRAHASEQNVPLLTVQAPSETVISCEDGKGLTFRTDVFMQDWAWRTRAFRIGERIAVVNTKEVFLMDPGTMKIYADYTV